MFLHAQGEVSPQLPTVKLITIDQTGREGMTFTLRAGETVCGRTNGIVLFDDPFVSPSHCKFQAAGGKLQVEDSGSLNGIYLRIRGERKLADGDFLRFGRQLFRFEHLATAVVEVKPIEGDDSRIWGSPQPTAFGRIVQVLEDGRAGEVRMLGGDRVQIGREVGDLVMPSDGFISGRHCVLTKNGTDVMLSDLGSSNGTYVRVRGGTDLAHGDFLLVGNQMLRVEIT
jgi:pSer/pThr/pTyr-binding forkhead associated (FHA) protein